MQLRRLQIEQSDSSDERKRIERQRLGALLALAEAPRCRRQTLLAYFGEQSEPCGNCDLCVEGVERFDGTIEAQKAMSAILRTGERFGVEHLVAILTGERTENVAKFNHDRLPTFGVGSGRKAGEWRSIFRQLSAVGLIAQDLMEHGRWSVTEEGRRVLKGEARIELRKDLSSGAAKGKAGARRDRRTATAAIVGDADAALLDSSLADLMARRDGADVTERSVELATTLRLDLAQLEGFDWLNSVDGMFEIPEAAPHTMSEADLAEFGTTYAQARAVALAADPDAALDSSGVPRLYSASESDRVATQLRLDAEQREILHALLTNARAAWETSVAPTVRVTAFSSSFGKSCP